ncbi:MAG: GNAT family N-acetyltransferase [Anaerolineae bacterium]|jgi:anti-sigma regulatory factor (Ser/Thr protein kinase)/RimJ/RimL family protein N-acetyltransferase
MARDTSILTIPNDTAYLPVVGAYMKAVAAQIGFDDADIGDIRLAVDEACTHVIETAFEPGEEQSFTVSCQRYPSGLRVTIADKGMPFDPHSIPAYDARGGPDRELRGLPFYLIQQAMDEVRFVNKGCEGKELQLTKYLKVPSVETYFPREELRPYDAKVEPAPPAKYTCRFMELTDAIEIARCVYKTYGYTYPGEHVYYPERVVTMNQSGELVSAVALTEAGEVVGHCALSGQPGDPVMEVGQAVVAPTHRGRGVMKELMDLLMKEARQRELAGLFATAVTLHPFSQRATHRYGFRDSALLLGYAPRDVHFKQIVDQQLPQRETVIYSYQSLHVDSACCIFPPDHHRSMVARIYDNLGLEREFASPGVTRLSIESSPLTSESVCLAVSTRIKSALGIAVIDITGYGPGIEQEVKNKLRDLCYEGIAVIYLNLPLGNPHTAVTCQYFEELGFFFSGILPRPVNPVNSEGMNGGDWLCLQYLNGPRVDYDLLRIYSDFGQELAQYIQERDPLA